MKVSPSYGPFLFLFQAALLHHANRALYQASIWTTCLQTQQNSPTPEVFGWINENGGLETSVDLSSRGGNGLPRTRSVRKDGLGTRLVLVYAIAEDNVTLNYHFTVLGSKIILLKLLIKVPYFFIGVK